MKGDKLPLCEPEYINECRRKPAKRTYTSSSIFVVLIFLLLAILTLVSWYSIEMFRNRNGSGEKPPFDPPPIDDLPKTARYIAHYMDWCIISTISIQYNGIPTGIPVSVADGPVDNGTGVPYIYIAPAAPTSKDLKHNASSSFSFSEAMSDYCLKKKYIAEFPKCARLTLAGKTVNVPDDEIPFAKKALFSRNPSMKHWPAFHKFYFMKLEISHVHILDTFGDAHEVPLKDYFAAKV